MDLLIYKDVFLCYFNAVRKAVKSDLEKQVIKILENTNSKIILNRKLVGYLEEATSGDDYFKTFIKHVIDSRASNIPSSSTSNSFEEEFAHLSGRAINNMTLKLSLSSFPGLSAIPGLAVAEEQMKPNYHWIVFTLAAGEVVTVRYYDFTTNQEIHVFFKQIFGLPAVINGVTIFDKQCNFGHNIFDAICNCRKKVYYYTYSESRVHALQRKSNANKKFGGGARLFFTNNTNFIHERKILFENVIIEVDDDFWNLTFNRPTWKVDVTFSPSINNHLKSKFPNFRECRE